jgi:hypothetical protein
LAALIATLGACESDPQGACPGPLLAAIQLEIRDLETGLPAACGSTATVVDGAFTETQTRESCDSPNSPVPDPLLPLLMTFAFGRPGTYDITIEKPGYKVWRTEGVRVGSNVCGVSPVTLQAFIEPLQQ